MITEIFGFINKIKFGVDGDVVDRLHHKYTVFLLIFLALFLTAETLVGERIKCFASVVYPKPWHNYITRLCWVNGTYYVQEDMGIAEAKLTGETHNIIYYQWAALILCWCAILFYMPCMLWHFFAERAGLNIDSMIKTCSDFNLVIEQGKREKAFVNLAHFLDRFFDSQANGDKRHRGIITKALYCFTRGSGSYLGCGYLITKVVYLINVVFQFIFMVLFLGQATHFQNFGLSITNFVSHGMVWEDNERFPRVTMCDVTTKKLGDVERHDTIQCLLPQNIYIEKAFVIVWWWFMALIVVTTLNLFQWITRICISNDDRSFIKRFLQSGGKYPIDREVARRNPTYRQKLDFLVRDYLKADGIFVIKLISKNVPALMMTQIVCEIWQHVSDNFKEEMRQRGIDETQLDDDDEYLDDVSRESPTDDSPNSDYDKNKTVDRNNPTLYPSAIA